MPAFAGMTVDISKARGRTFPVAWGKLGVTGAVPPASSAAGTLHVDLGACDPTDAACNRPMRKHPVCGPRDWDG